MRKNLLDRFSIFHRKKVNVIRTFNRGESDNLLLTQSFENGLQFLTEKGFTSTRPFSQVAYGTLLLRYTGPFNVDIERDERLDVAVYIDPLHVDKPPTMRRISVEGMIFLASECSENITQMSSKFWDPLDYEEGANLVCGKFQEHYEKIAWLMREENVGSVYDELNRIHKDFIRTIGSPPQGTPHDHPA